MSLPHTHLLFEWCVGIYPPNPQLFTSSCASGYYNAIVGIYAQIVGVQCRVGSNVSIHSIGEGGSAPHLMACAHYGHLFSLVQEFYIKGQMFLSSYNAVYGSFAVLPPLDGVGVCHVDDCPYRGVAMSLSASHGEQRGLV